jgi:uncharacterized iron-regulated membrane protein
MKLLRKIFFWAHLVAGLVAGLSIAVMCFTGAVLAFEKQIVAWSERDARRVTPPAADAPRLSLDELARRVRETNPDARPAGVTLSADPRDAVAFSLGRDSAVYANPYTGEVRAPASTKVHDFMHVMEDWHRVLALGGDNRPIGKAINGACNLAFFFLAVSGLYLWWPRSLTWRGFRAVTLFNWRLTGKARDFNWHNSIGLWSAPVLVVLTLTAVPISYRWGGDLIYRLVGETPPAQGQGPGGPMGAASTEAFKIERPSPDARPLPQSKLLARVQADFPRWEQITFRTGGMQRGQRPAQNSNAAAPRDGAAAGERREARTPRPEGASATENRGNREGRTENRTGGTGTGEARGPQPLTVTIRESGAWPRTATTTLTLHPFTGEVLKREGYADLSPARQIRSWTRFLHTGEALGVGGQLVAGLACLGGCLLVYTGFALSWRRFFSRTPAKSPATAM